MKRLTISRKLTLSYLAIGLLTVIIISLVFYNTMKKALLERTFAQLSSINQLKKNQIEDFFDYQKKKIVILQHHPAVTSLISNLNKPLLHDYKSFNDLRVLKEDDEFDELIFLDSLYNPVYSSNPESVTLNLILKDPLKWQSINQDDVLRDVSQSEDVPAVLHFVSLHKKEGSKIGYLLIKDRFSKAGEMLRERTGMGSSGESYLVADDFTMRSASRFSKDNPLKINVTTQASRNSLKGKEGQAIIDDYRGVPVLSVYRKLDIDGLEWAIISEIDLTEAMQPVNDLRNIIVIIAVLFSILITAVTIILAEKISSPVLKLKNILLRISKGDHKIEVPQIAGSDEIAQMTSALGALVKQLKETTEFAEEIGKGNFKKTYDPVSDYDVLGKALISMRDKLQKLKQQEIAFVRQRSASLLEGQENERRRLSRELHDGLGQQLTLIKLKMNQIADNAELKGELKKLIDESITEIRRISNNLTPAVLSDFGLEPALRMLCESTSKLFNMKVNFINEKQADAKLPYQMNINLYRIAQEALNNAVKYSKAEMIDLYLKQNNQSIVLQIQDNGTGFNLKSYHNDTRQKNGLKNMKERAEIHKGSFKIQTKKGRGTSVMVIIPLSKKPLANDQNKNTAGR